MGRVSINLDGAWREIGYICTARVSTQVSDAGYFWRCDGCGHVGYGLTSYDAADREARRHVAESGTGLQSAVAGSTTTAVPGDER